MQNTTQLTQHSYFTNCAEISDSNFNLLTQQQQTQFTQAEKAFVLQFVADVVQSLTTINVENVEEEQYFVRLTDTLEVLDNLQMLYSNVCNNTAKYNFTLAQAATAICCYDTEYRETITEQFENECAEAGYTTLALRIVCSY